MFGIFGGYGSTPNQDLLGSLGAQQEVLDQWVVATWIYQLVICLHFFGGSCTNRAESRLVSSDNLSRFTMISCCLEKHLGSNQHLFVLSRKNQIMCCVLHIYSLQTLIFGSGYMMVQSLPFFESSCYP